MFFHYVSDAFLKWLVHRLKKRQALSLGRKYEIVSFWERNKNLKQKNVADKFDIPASTLSKTLKAAAEVKAEFQAGSG